MWKFLVYTSSCIIGCGLVLHIIGLAIPSWSVDDYDSSISKGLWVQCNAEECESFDPASVQPVRALVLIAMVCGLGGLVLVIWKTIVYHRYDDVGKKAFYFAIAFASGSMVFTIIGVILWSTSIHTDLDDWHLGAGFGLNLCGGIIIFIGGLIAVVSAVRVI